MTVDEGIGDLDLSATWTRRVFLLDPDPCCGPNIAVTFTSGAPAWINREHGQGRVALLATTIERDCGDLPQRPGFVPLAVRTITWVARVSGQELGSVIHIGARDPLWRAPSYSGRDPDRRQRAGRRPARGRAGRVRGD